MASRKFLVGDQLTTSDIRLFNTLIRMDEVYVTYFKTYFAGLLTRKYPNLLAHTARMWHGFPEIRKSVSMEDICNHYYTSHMIRNWYAVVPMKVGFVEELEKMKESMEGLA